MSLEAIDMVMKAEQDGVSRRAAAEQDARNLTLNAERDGQAMLSLSLIHIWSTRIRKAEIPP